jgi:hypothetical protein
MQPFRRRFDIAMLAFLMVASALPSLGQEQDKKSKAEAKDAAKAQKIAEAQNLPAVLWRDLGDVSALDLTGGPGGREKAPKSGGHYTFVKEDLNGTSTKFYVKDAEGVEWLAKIGEEARPETVATRFVWAMGYFADEDYFVDSIHVDNMPKLKHGKNHKSVKADVKNVRLKRQNSAEKSIGNWSWYDNPFVGTREFNGLRVMMALMNNWDLKEVNNKIYPVDGAREFVVSDLGATFGKTGAVTTRSKGKLRDYEHSEFIVKRTPEFVSLKMSTRPSFFLKPFEHKNYEMRAKMETITKEIPRADVQWIAMQLSRLTPTQIRDAFRAADLAPEIVEGYAKTIETRINELKAEGEKSEVRAAAGKPQS